MFGVIIDFFFDMLTKAAFIWLKILWKYYYNLK